MQKHDRRVVAIAMNGRDVQRRAVDVEPELRPDKFTRHLNHLARMSPQRDLDSSKATEAAYCGDVQSTSVEQKS
ncbi:hypothetical protein [Burkholderia lata]|uniref:hypothetical protein n=1 Tax=Burkholderia lata (strain ATCC 17760 / DSM 23089 / LMG 22485 / NCIMB 9086 / R18194 / 383) TaxID=482957 RepID=UPI001584203D|nr:hypothetical protein [Burkholderia lata]